MWLGVPMTDNDDMIALGIVGRAKGLDGSFRLVFYNPDSTQLDQSDEILLQSPDGVQEVHSLVKSQGSGERGIRIVKTESITSRTEAEGRKGWSLMVQKSALPSVSDGEFYYHEMPGYSVETEAGQRVGTIKNVIQTNIDIFVIERTQGGELLIPVIEEMVCSIDQDQRRVVVVDDIEERFEDVL